MRSKGGWFLVVALSVLGLAGVASAHHGPGSFDQTKIITLKGTVTNFTWSNPHGGIDFDVRDSKGNVENWQGSLTSPNWLARAGWTKNTLKPGDVITISGNQSKSRPNALWVKKIQLANGQELSLAGVENFQ